MYSEVDREAVMEQGIFHSFQRMCTGHLPLRGSQKLCWALWIESEM